LSAALRSQGKNLISLFLIQHSTAYLQTVLYAKERGRCSKPSTIQQLQTPLG
jgi:hypothetical protein